MAMKPSSKFGKMNATKNGNVSGQNYNADFKRETDKAGYKRANEIGGIGAYIVKGLATGKGATEAARSDVRKEMAPAYRRDALQKLAREKGTKKPTRM